MNLRQKIVVVLATATASSAVAGSAAFIHSERRAPDTPMCDGKPCPAVIQDLRRQGFDCVMLADGSAIECVPR
jgi:hypothetical protein